MTDIKVRRNAAQWREIVERQRSSGQSVVAFCQAEGLALSTFTRWQRILRNSALTSPKARQAMQPQSAATPLFAPLTPAPMPEAPSKSAPSLPGAWRVELDLGAGIRLILARVA